MERTGGLFPFGLFLFSAAASPLVTLRGCACCQLLFRAEPQGVDF
jgi:hypothetical protein